MSELLPGFEPSEQDMIDMALAMPYGIKHDKLMLFHKIYSNGAYGGFSGGKDSCVIEDSSRKAGVDVDWHYNNVTIDPPELVWFIKKLHPKVKWNNPRTHLLRRMVEKANCPTRRGRWCCQEYKENGGAGQDKVIGVRISESVARARRWSLVAPDKKSNANYLCPVCYWTDADIWRYIHENHVPYCELYDETDDKGCKMFTRLGCIGCPNAGACQVEKEFQRWPRYREAWRVAFGWLWVRWHGVPTQRARATTFMSIQGHWYPDRALFAKDFTENEWLFITTRNLEIPETLSTSCHGSLMIGMTRQRYFEKYQSGDGFFDWWRSGGAFEGENTQCVFEDMMEQR